MAKRAYHHGDLRAAMLTAAETVLDRDGPDALTLRAAARQAGVSHAAPVHHFGDLSGLLSVLAASGFRRFRDHLLATVEAVDSDPASRNAALCQGYIGFARAHPGLFQLMFRSSRLDWSRRELASAAEAALVLLTDDAKIEGEPSLRLGFGDLAAALARWSMAHGAAMLLLDGRFDALAAKQGVDSAALIVAMARHLPLNHPKTSDEVPPSSSIDGSSTSSK